MEKYLPIGTVVLLTKAEKRVMITGYFPMIKKETEEEKYDYSGCLFPEGILDINQTLVFNHEQVEYVYYYGLIDEEQKDFMKTLFEEKNNNEIEMPAINNNSDDDSDNNIEKLEL